MKYSEVIERMENQGKKIQELSNEIDALPDGVEKKVLETRLAVIIISSLGIIERLEQHFTKPEQRSE